MISDVTVKSNVMVRNRRKDNVCQLYLLMHIKQKQLRVGFDKSSHLSLTNFAIVIEQSVMLKWSRFCWFASYSGHYCQRLWLCRSVCLSVCPYCQIASSPAVLVGISWYFNTMFSCAECLSGPRGYCTPGILWRHKICNLENFKWRYLWNKSSNQHHVWF